jgi:hypothetical protein
MDKTIFGWLKRLTTRVQTLETDFSAIVAATPEVVTLTTGTQAVTTDQANSDVVLTNTGAAATATFTLPAATPGMRVTAFVKANQQLRLDPNGTETIALPSTGVQGAAGKYLWADAVGEYVQLVCVTAGTWSSIGYFGTWTAES